MVERFERNATGSVERKHRLPVRGSRRKRCRTGRAFREGQECRRGGSLRETPVSAVERSARNAWSSWRVTREESAAARVTRVARYAVPVRWSPSRGDDQIRSVVRKERAPTW